MRITTSTDLQSGTFLIVLEGRIRENAHRAADEAWAATETAVKGAQRASRQARQRAVAAPAERSEPSE